MAVLLPLYITKLSLSAFLLLIWWLFSMRGCWKDFSLTCFFKSDQMTNHQELFGNWLGQELFISPLVITFVKINGYTFISIRWFLLEKKGMTYLHVIMVIWSLLQIVSAMPLLTRKWIFIILQLFLFLLFFFVFIIFYFYHLKTKLLL